MGKHLLLPQVRKGRYMIAFLDGVVAAKAPTSVLLNVGGVGFQVGMSTSSLAALPETGEHAVVHTYLQVRDDGMSLFGFMSQEEKALFEKLITVSGVGPKVALAALSTYTPAQIADFVTAQDVAAIQRVPGIGKKMASRIILELKGSLAQGLGGLFADEQPSESPALADARAALLSMGFTEAEVELSLKDAPSAATDSALLQYALKKLGS